MGLPLEIKELTYTNGVPEDMEIEVEQYLQRCVFDDTVSLRQMLMNPITGPYLELCQKDGMWQFSQNVDLIFINAPNEWAIFEFCKTMSYSYEWAY